MYQQQTPEQTPPVVTHQVSHLQGGVVVPLLQAVITGAFLGLAALAITAWFNAPFWGIAGTTASVTAAGSWLAYRSRWQWVVERLLGVDLNGDGSIGQPQPVNKLPPIRLEIIEDGGRTGRYPELPWHPRLPELAAAVVERNRPLTQKEWVNSGTFSRTEFDAIVESLVNARLANWKNPEHHNVGVELTTPGRHVLKTIATRPPALFPPE